MSTFAECTARFEQCTRHRTAMHTAHCTLGTRCSSHIAERTLFALCTLHTLLHPNSTQHCAHQTLGTVQCTLRALYVCTLHVAHCTSPHYTPRTLYGAYSMYCTLCTLHIAHCVFCTLFTKHYTICTLHVSYSVLGTPCTLVTFWYSIQILEDDISWYEVQSYKVPPLHPIGAHILAKRKWPNPMWQNDARMTKNECVRI